MKIVLLAGKGESTTFIYNGLQPYFCVEKVLIEDPVPAKQLVRRRIKKLGFPKVINQLFFQLIISKLLSVISVKRVATLKKQYSLSSNDIPPRKVKLIHSVNDKTCLEELQSLKPDVVLVNGTRIISKTILNCIEAVFINSHVGITPQYRGVHGGYWSLVNQDRKNCGVTVHLVDPGIDTGSILRQERIFPDKQDNFATYPYHHYGTAVKMLKTVLQEFKDKRLQPYKKGDVESKLYYHPTFTDYLYHYFIKGVK